MVLKDPTDEGDGARKKQIKKENIFFLKPKLQKEKTGANVSHSFFD